MTFLFRKTAFLPLFLASCYLLSPTANAADMYDAVKSDIEAGRTEIALGSLQGIIKQRPGAYQAWFLIGVAHARQQQFHQAIEAFQHVIELNPLLAEPHNNLAVIYNELGDVRAAVSELEQSLKKRPDYAIVEENIADLYVKLALKNYRNALEKEPREGLEKRYMRLLQVRNPTSEPARITEIPENVAMVDSTALKQVADSREEESVVEQAVLIKPEQPEQLPEPLSEPMPKPSPLPVVKADISPIDNGELAKVEPVENEVLKAVESWRSAWASRDLAGYFSAYANDFKVPERFGSLADWQEYKQRVIGSKTYIQVKLSDIQVEIDQGKRRANVKFLQKFSSNGYNGDTLKVLQMRLDNDAWKIVSEVSVS